MSGGDEMIKEYRKSKKLTQKQLAARVGVSQAYICSLELGKRRNPSISILYRIAEETGAPLQSLVKQYLEVG